MLDELRDRKEEYRRPDKALEIICEVHAPSVEGAQPSLVGAAELILKSDYSDVCISDRENAAANDRRYTLTSEVYDRLNHVVSGLSLAVSDMLALEGRRHHGRSTPRVRSCISPQAATKRASFATPISYCD